MREQHKNGQSDIQIYIQTERHTELNYYMDCVDVQRFSLLLIKRQIFVDLILPLS